MTIYTIGFTKKSAEQFFELLRDSGARRIVDIRLNNVSQLAGFSKKNDLAYFAKAICGMDYVHLPELAPTQEMLDAYKKNGGDWDEYERQFLALIEERKIAETTPKEIIDGACLLCSEETPEHCHRRLVAKYLASHWPDVSVRHLI